ncbi:GntR family transcriptional regulator [Streptomyces sp. NPDC059455]|uniref:GntR family transcriptional regulator n=1 Tax=Streptomyces sp. NPDC059455 TaxID=3346837 RepID=UPI0036A22E6F
MDRPQITELMRAMDGAQAAGGQAPLGTVSAVDALAAALSERVIAADLKPGDRIRESTLAAEYQVARHTARSALSRLTTSGLMTYQPNRGWSVSEVSPEEFADITFLRIGLEVQAMREIAARGEKVSPEARGLLEQLLNTELEMSWPERLKIDMELHRALVDQAGSQRLSEAYRGVQLSLQLYFAARLDWFESMPEKEFRDLHRTLCDVIDSGDPDLVERHLRQQLDYNITSD